MRGPDAIAVPTEAGPPSVQRPIPPNFAYSRRTTPETGIVVERLEEVTDEKG